MGKPYSYFARAVRGGRENLENCKTIVSEMEKYSTVLSKHVISDNVFAFERKWKRKHPNVTVFQRDKRWLDMSEYFVADLSVESTGVGWETCYAVAVRGIPSTLFCIEDSKPIGIHMNKLLKGVGYNIPVVYYTNQNLKEIVEKELKGLFEAGKVL